MMHRRIVLPSLWLVLGSIAQTQENRAPKIIPLEEAEATATEDLIKQSPPSVGQVRASDTSPDTFTVLNAELNVVAGDTLKATHLLLEQLDSFLVKF